MAGRPEVGRRVLIRRAVAAADVPARQAQPEMEPLSTGPQAVRAAIAAGLDVADGNVLARRGVGLDSDARCGTGAETDPGSGRTVAHVNRAMSASAAQLRKWVAPQTGSVPAMKDSSLKPNTSIVMPHGDSFTPSSTARSRSSSIEATP